jgi:gamma-tubulin complex component 2
MPLLLESWKYKILLAGKYLNVIECGIEVQVDQKDLTKNSPSMEDEKCISS